MKRTSLIVATLCTIVCFSACKEKKFRGFTKTETGLYYKITTKNAEGKIPQQGDYLFLTVSFDADFDSTFFLPTRPMESPLYPSLFQGDVFEAYSLLKEGEEGEFYIKADSFIIHFMRMIPPATVKPEDVLHFKIKLDKVKTMEEFEKEEKEAVQAYITENNITVEPTESGMYYIETLAGKGAKAENGKMVEVHYTGKFLDGTVFDSSEGREPFSFPLGMGRVIQGWEEGIALMREGGKATFIIPSDLAYGNGGGRIPPFATLVFNVELLKVSDAETAAVNPLN